MKMPNDAIREEILLNGAISFERFMALALYCPETGYYERQKDNVGRAGDFVTSVSTGQLFGELLAFQFAEWLAGLPETGKPPTLIEAGAHDAKLAADILAWLELKRPQLFARLEYGIVEPSTRRESWQRETLGRFAGKVRWHRELDELKSATGQFSGVLFGNELLDAFPVRRFGWSAIEKHWFEWGVTAGSTNQTFTWKPLPLTAPSPLAELPVKLLNVLPDQYTIEICPAAENWWRQAAGLLAHGKMVAIDYGFTDAERFSPARTRGTLRAYHRHHVTDDLLAQPGEQDLTAHVNFSAIQQAGEAAGLKTDGLTTQPRFLTHILDRALKQGDLRDWDAKKTRQFQTLTHPEHLGRAFNVLVQGI